MKILLVSYTFYPKVGGIEMISALLAQEFIRQGHDVKVATLVANGGEEPYDFPVHRAPSRRQMLRLTRWCDVCFHNNISLQMLWPLLLVRRPWVVAHRTWIARLDGSLSWQDRLKRFLLRWSTGISISQAVADHISTPSTVIGNPYRDDLFFEMPDVSRDRDLVFLGRLVDDKGADLLLDAVGELKSRGLRPSLSIIGDGPERDALQTKAASLGIEGQMEFLGTQTGPELTRLLNRHRIMVVPSRWNEPFGIVALEGLACGCVVVGSEGGGLKDAIGAGGVTFRNGDAAALANTLETLLRDEDLLERHRRAAPAHLARHRKDTVAAAYLGVIESAYLKSVGAGR